MAKWLDKYEQGGLVLKKKTKDNYGKKPNPNNVQASVGPDFVGMGNNTKGRNYSPAWGGQFQDGGFLQPTSSKLPEGYVIPYNTPSTELAMSIGGEKGEPAYLIPTFKYGKPLKDPVAEFKKTGEHLGGPFKTWQEAEKFGEMRHKYVEKGKNIPSPYKWWDEMQNGGKKKKKNIEDQMERWLGHPMQKAEQATDRYAKPGEKQRDNIRHSMAGRFTSEAIQNKLYNIPGISQLAGFIGASAAGLGHELIKPNRGSAKRPYSWYYTVREGAEDQFNNMVGAAIGSTPFINKDQKDKVIKYLSDHNMLTDGYIGKDNIYRKHGMNKKLQNGDTLSEVTVKASKKRKDNVLLHDPQDYEGGHKYSLKKTVTPYKSNRQIRLNTEAVDNPNDIDFLYNYRHTADNTMDETAVPYEGDRHWNIDRFITDPAFGKGYGKLESADNSMEAERRNVLADMFKYQMYQHPEQSRGKSFRQAKRFVRKEIDPRVSGPYFQSYMREGVYPPGTGGLTTFTNNNPFFAAWENMQWEETQGNKEYRKNPWDEAKVEEVAKDYLRNIKKLSRKETNEQIKNWKTEAKSKIENYYKPSTVINSDTPAFYSTGDDQKDYGLNYPEEAAKSYFDLLKENKKSQLPNKKIAMGGSIPGAVGFTYARTAGAAPSNGKYAKKTKASAQDGKQVVDNSVLLNFDTSDPAFGYVKESNFVNFDPKNFEGIKQNMARYMNSPLYMERLSKSIPDQEVAKDVQKQRLDNLLSVKLNPKTGDQGTYYNLLQNRVNLGANDFVDNPSIAHEVAHGIIPITNASYGKKNLLSKAAIAIGGLFQPFEKFTESELEKINRPLSGRVTAPNEIYQKAIQEEHYAPQGSKASARTAAGETYGDLTGMRQLLLDNGITTEFGQELTPEMFQKALKNPKISNEPVFQRMKLKFKDEDIIKMNNEVAQLNNAAPLTQAQNGKEMRFYQQGLDFTPKNISKNGSVIKDDMGQWAHPGEITEINSNDITMEGVDYPVLGISDTGDTKLMQPGENYKFKGKKVTEFPMMKNGGWLDKYTPKAQDGENIPEGMTLPTVTVTSSKPSMWGKFNPAQYEQNNRETLSQWNPKPGEIEAMTAAEQARKDEEDSWYNNRRIKSLRNSAFADWKPYAIAGGITAAPAISSALGLGSTAAALATPIAGVPGLTGANILNAGFAYQGLKHVPGVAEDWKTAVNDPSFGSVGTALLNTGLTTLDVLPFAAEVMKGAKYLNKLNNAANISKETPVIDDMGEIINAAPIEESGSRYLYNPVTGQTLQYDVNGNIISSSKKLTKAEIIKHNKNMRSIQHPGYTPPPPKGMEPYLNSEINWGAWNSEIPKNQELMREYAAIEQNAKQSGTWMKNADGTPFTLPDGKLGTPEQFVQMQSKNFKKAFPEGVDITYRGDAEHYPALRPENSPFFGKSIFTANEDLARFYTPKGPKAEYFTPFEPTAQQNLENYIAKNFKPGYTVEQFLKDYPQLSGGVAATETAGLHQLAIPKTKNVLNFNAAGQDFSLLSDPAVYKKLTEEGIIPHNRPTKGVFDTDNIAEYIEKAGLDRAVIQNVDDGSIGNVLIHNQQPGKFAKSLRGNSGMFDMNNPNIYKALIPAIGVGALKKIIDSKEEKKNGGWLNKYK